MGWGWRWGRGVVKKAWHMDEEWNGNKDRKQVGDRLKTGEEIEIGWDGGERNKMGLRVIRPWRWGWVRHVFMCGAENKMGKEI